MEEVAVVGGGSQPSGTHGPLDLDPVALPPYQASGTHGPLDLDPVSDGVAAVSMSIEDVNAIKTLIETIQFEPSVRKVINGLSLTLGVVRGGQEATVTTEYILTSSSSSTIS